MPKTKIGWTDEALNFYTWNCNKVSDGCKHCYAQTHARQYPQNSKAGEFLGVPLLRAKAFDELRLIKPGQTVFVNTHSDTFHEGVPIDWLRKIFTHMNQRSDLIFLLLTKRPEIALKRTPYLRWTENIWFGVSMETQEWHDRRLVPFVNVPARHKFVSFEPLLSAIAPAFDLTKQLDWIIVGGESGEIHRPFGKQWAVDLQQWAATYTIPFFFKQGSAVLPGADRLLGGRTYDEQPVAFEQLRQRYHPDSVQPTLF